MSSIEYSDYMNEVLTEIHKPMIKEEPEKLIKAKIMKVLEHNGETPKHRDKWMKNITYYGSMIRAGYQAIWFWNNGNTMTRTSYVESVEEDENNLVVTTDNSVYHIKKFQD